MSRVLFFLFSLSCFGGQWYGGMNLKDPLYNARDHVFEALNALPSSAPHELRRQLKVMKQRLYKHPWWVGRVSEIDWIKTDLYLISRLKKTWSKDKVKGLETMMLTLDTLSQRYKSILKTIR